jgi:hypothetical protein
MTADPIDRLLHEPPFAAAPTATFVEAVASCLAVLRQRFPRYDDFLRRRGTPEDAPASLAEVDALPGLFLPVLKGMRFDVPAGEVGLLELTVPLTTSYPLLKVLTTNKASLRTGCSCGRPGSYLTPHGRAAVARYETCAM